MWFCGIEQMEYGCRSRDRLFDIARQALVSGEGRPPRIDQNHALWTGDALPVARDLSTTIEKRSHASVSSASDYFRFREGFSTSPKRTEASYADSRTRKTLASVSFVSFEAVCSPVHAPAKKRRCISFGKLRKHRPRCAQDPIAACNRARSLAWSSLSKARYSLSSCQIKRPAMFDQVGLAALALNAVQHDSPLFGGPACRLSMA